MKTKNMHFSTQNVDEKGAFSGYGSVFGNVDSYGEIVMPGAFAKSLQEWRTRGRLPPVLWNHDSNKPIGFYTDMREDVKGLYVEGQLLIDSVKQAAETYALLKAGVIGGMSIGYNIASLDVEDGPDGEPLLKLNEVALWEVSLVTFPANEAAQVSQIKSVLQQGDIPTETEFVRLLTESGFSTKQAAAIAKGGLKSLHTAPQPDYSDILQLLK